MNENALVQRIAELNAIWPTLPKTSVFDNDPNNRRNVKGEADRLRSQLDELRASNQFNNIVSNRSVELQKDPAGYWGKLLPPPGYPMAEYLKLNKHNPALYDAYAAAEQAFVDANRQLIASGGNDPAMFDRVQQLKQAADNAYTAVYRNDQQFIQDAQRSKDQYANIIDGLASKVGDIQWRRDATIKAYNEAKAVLDDPTVFPDFKEGAQAQLQSSVGYLQKLDREWADATSRFQDQLADAAGAGLPQELIGNFETAQQYLSDPTSIQRIKEAPTAASAEFVKDVRAAHDTNAKVLNEYKALRDAQIRASGGQTAADRGLVADVSELGQRDPRLLVEAINNVGAVPTADYLRRYGLENLPLDERGVPFIPEGFQFTPQQPVDPLAAFEAARAKISPILPDVSVLTQDQAQDAINTALQSYAQGTGQTVQQLQSRPDVQQAIDKALSTATFAPPEDLGVGTRTTSTVANPVVPKDQADKLAREFVISGNFQVTGTDDPLGMVSNLIQRVGVDDAIAQLQAQNINFYGQVPKFDPTLADTVMRRMYSVVPNIESVDKDPNFARNKISLQNFGLEETIKRFAEANNVSEDALRAAITKNPGKFGDKRNYGFTIPEATGFTEGAEGEEPVGITKDNIIDLLNKQSEVNLGSFKDQQFTQFQTNISDILAGKDPRPVSLPTNINPEEAVTQIFESKGISVGDNKEAYDNWVNYFKNYGIDTGVALFEDRLENAGFTGRQGDIQIAGLPENYNFFTGSSTFPTFPTQTTPGTTGTTGAPGYPGYTPPTYTPPSQTGQAYYPSPGMTPTPYQSRPLITPAERPALDTAIEYIESTRPGAGPMPYMTSQQVGGTPTAPGSYADLFGYTPYTEYMGQSEYTTPMTPNLYADMYQGQAAAVTPTAGMKRGGSVADARGLAALGRNGDTMLVHMAPEEVAGLRALALRDGTDLTINPDTGLPEAFNFKRFARQVLLPAAAAYFGAPYIGLGNAAMAIGAGAALKSGNLQTGLQIGMAAYGGASLANSAFGASSGVFGAPANATTTTTTAPGSAAPVGAEYGGIDGAFAAEPTLAAQQSAAQQAAVQTAALTPQPTITPSDIGIGGIQPGVADSQLVSNPAGAVFPPTASNVGTAAGGVKTGASASNKIFGMEPSTAVIGGTMLAGLSQGEKERDLYEEERRRQDEEEARRKRLGQESFERSLQPINTRTMYGAGGGLVALARGGMTYMEAGGTTGATGEPRMVAGTGDGMSDSVPATIEGVQEARLANDEFVIPADVVADIGNGSSSAGARKLYDMMDRIREARHGTTEQPPEVNAEQYMPA